MLTSSDRQARVEVRLLTAVPLAALVVMAATSSSGLSGRSRALTTLWGLPGGLTTRSTVRVLLLRDLTVN